jgi:hypothetical protein
MAKQYGFERIVLSDLPEFKSEAVEAKTPTTEQPVGEPKLNKSKEQIKLEKANAINDVLSRRIIKGKSEVYDDIENEVRSFLNNKLGTILGSEQPDTFSKDEIFLLRALINRLKEKENK